MAYETTDQLIAEAADHWNKRDDTVFYQLLDVYNEHLNKISDEAEKVDRWRMLKEAKGTTLDLLGQDRKAYRISDDDDTYRFIIFIHILMSHAQGTIPSMVKIMSTALNADPDKFEVYKTGLRHVGMKIPFDYVQTVQMQKFIIKNIQNLLAMGYWIDEIKFYTTSRMPLYIGVGTQDHTTQTMRSKTLWWSGWKAKSDQPIYVGTHVTVQKSIREETSTSWWDGWKSRTSQSVHVGIHGQIQKSKETKSKTIWWNGWNAKTADIFAITGVGQVSKTQVWHTTASWADEVRQNITAGLAVGNLTTSTTTQTLKTE